MDIVVSSQKALHWRGKEYRCALGRGGVTQGKREGDEATPLGCFPIREVMYRADKLPKPITSIHVTIIQEDDGWCDDVNDPNYNKKVLLPYPARHEEMWRADNLYDIIVTLGYNDDPVVPGKGSAIFIHIATPEYAPTAGCVALSAPDLLQILKEVSGDTLLCIK